VAGSAGAGSLPADLTSFVDRRQEVATVRRLLSESRLVTLTGPGGVGKSRLAVRVAAQFQRAFPDGVWLVELGQLQDPVLLPRTLSGAIGATDQPARTPTEVLTRFLGMRELLIVFDNCEHMVEACAVLLSELLRAAPGLHVLATSRVALRVPGEQLYALPPLSVPDPADALSPAAAEGYAGVALFVERAAGAPEGFVMTAGNAGAVQRVCQRLDGLPLAIELAAVQLRSISVEQLALRLDDLFHLLTGGSPVVPPRHQTLRATMDWSFALCSEAERTLWVRSSIFVGRFDLAAAEQICSGDGLPAQDVLHALTGLIDKSVLIAEAGASELRYRYRMLETVREYGLARLRNPDAGQWHVVSEAVLRARHRAFYLQLAETFDRSWFGPDQLLWSEHLHAELAELRQSLATTGDAGVSLRMAAALHYFWLCCGEVREGRLWLERALTANPDPSPERARALAIYSRLVMTQGFVAEVEDPTRECLALARTFSDPVLLADALNVRGLYLMFSGDPVAGTALLDEARDRGGAQGPVSAAFVNLYSALGAVFRGDARRAGELFGGCQAICEANGEQWMLGYCVINSLPAALRLGDLAGTVNLVRSCIPIHQRLNDTLALTLALEYLSWAAAADRDYRRAALLLGAADQQWIERGGSPLGAGEYLSTHDRCLATSRAALGEAGFEAQYQRGARLTLDDALGYALHVAPAGADPAPRPPSLSETALTRRQREIAALIAQGLSNQQIASRLVISRRTAEGHVENILMKLGFTSRSQIAAWYARVSGPGT
jgi:predicted ATPase/DNA-binding CsgD family transcriptional regulator